MNDRGRVTTDTIVEALEYVRQHADELGIRVVNISVYADEVDQTTDHPVNEAVEKLVKDGICVISAAGNNPNVRIRPPAAAPSGIAVGGLNDNNSLRTDDDTMYPSNIRKDLPRDPEAGRDRSSDLSASSDPARHVTAQGSSCPLCDGRHE